MRWVSIILLASLLAGCITKTSKNGVDRYEFNPYDEEGYSRDNGGNGQ